MAGPIFADRVQENSSTTGTGTYTLSGATTGYQAWSVVGNTNTAYYMATDNVGWEVGLGTYTLAGTTLARTTILASSNANAAVNWTAGTRTVSLVDSAAVLFNYSWPVATRTVMAALAITQMTTAYLLESGRQGMFRWNSSNLSAFVTVDTQQGVYVPPASDTTGASGAWVRADSINLTPFMFGAVGDCIQVQATCSITSGAAALTATGASFTVADVGKRIVVLGAGVAGAPLATTIASRTDATHVGLSANASTTLTASSQFLTYGTDDTTALRGYAALCGYTGAPFRITDTPNAYAISGKIQVLVTRQEAPANQSPASNLYFTDNLPFEVVGAGKARVFAMATMTSMLEVIFNTPLSNIAPFYTWVHNLQLDGLGLATAGIVGNYAGSAEYSNNRIANVTRGIDYTGYGTSLIHHNSIRAKYGVYLLGGGGDSTIKDNNFFSGENTSACVYHGYYGGNIITRDNVFTNQEGYSNAYGIQADGSTAATTEEIRHIVVEGNEFSGLTSGISAIGKATGNRNVWNWQIQGNHVTPLGAANTGTLLVAQDCTDFIVDDNMINGLRLIDSTGKGIDLTRCERFIIDGNLFGAIGLSPITMVDCIDCGVAGNRFDDTGKTSAALAIVDISGAAGLRNSVRRNIFRQSSASYAQLGVKEGAGVDYTYANGNDFYTVGTPYTQVGANSRMLTTVDNTIARYDGTWGTVKSSGVVVDNSNNISGLGSVTSGVLTPTVSSSDFLSGIIQTATNFAGGVTIKKRGATGDNTAAIASFGEIGYHSFYGWDSAAYGRGAFVLVASTQAWTAAAHGTQYEIYTTPNGSITNALALHIDQDQSALFKGQVKLDSPTAGLGYTTGAGGTVTQATNKATGVTLSKVSGAITMNAAALAAGTIVSFVLTNTAIAATDVLILNHISGGTPGSYSLNARAAAGSATIDVRNNTAGSLSEAVVIGFALIKAVTA